MNTELKCSIGILTNLRNTLCYTSGTPYERKTKQNVFVYIKDTKHLSNASLNDIQVHVHV